MTDLAERTIGLDVVDKATPSSTPGQAPPAGRPRATPHVTPPWPPRAKLWVAVLLVAAVLGAVGTVIGFTSGDDTATTPLGRVLAAGLLNRMHSREVMKESIEEVGRQVVLELERYLNTLGTIAAISPLLGLLGTVYGMIDAFHQTSQSGGAAKTADLANAVGGRAGSLAGTLFSAYEVASLHIAVGARHPDVPLVVLGESMGGAVTLVAATTDPGGRAPVGRARCRRRDRGCLCTTRR